MTYQIQIDERQRRMIRDALRRDVKHGLSIHRAKEFVSDEIDLAEMFADLPEDNVPGTINGFCL